MNVNELIHPHGLFVILLSLQCLYIEHVSPANMVVYRVKRTVIWCLHCCEGRKSVPIGYKVAFWESEDWNADRLPYQLCPALTLSSRPAPFLETLPALRTVF